MINSVTDHKKLKQVLCSLPIKTLMLYPRNLYLYILLFNQGYSSDFANFTDDNTPVNVGRPKLNKVMMNLEIATENV